MFLRYQIIIRHLRHLISSIYRMSDKLEGLGPNVIVMFLILQTHSLFLFFSPVWHSMITCQYTTRDQHTKIRVIKEQNNKTCYPAICFGISSWLPEKLSYRNWTSHCARDANSIIAGTEQNAKEIEKFPLSYAVNHNCGFPDPKTASTMPQQR